MSKRQKRKKVRLDIGPRTLESDALADVYRKAPALAVASQILQGYKHSRGDKEEASLADMFVASSYREPVRMRGRSRKLMEDAMMQYRHDMKRAHRFVMDDAFTEMATHMATVEPTKMLARIQYATLPYEVTWIEFNLRAKMRVIRQLHKLNSNDYSDIAPRLGMLLQRINDTGFVCTLVSEVDGIASPHMTCYFVSTTEEDFANSGNKFFGCRPMIIQATEDTGHKPPVEIPEAEMAEYMQKDSLGKATLWGYTRAPGLIDQLGNAKAEDMLTPNFLLRHGDVGFSRVYDPYNLNFGSNQQKFTDLVISELHEFTGHMRWLVTVLAMLNEVPVYNYHMQPTGYLRASTFKKHNFLDYHRVSLKLPKTNPIKYFQRKLSHTEIHHRAHEVRSHWRTYLHDVHCRPDAHVWEYDHEEGYRLCGKCMAFSRLIKEHIRGNAELGWVRKDYVLTKA